MTKFLQKLAHPLRSPAVVTLYYLLFAGLWIYLSSWQVNPSLANSEYLRHFELFKGLAFVGLTAFLLYLLLKGWNRPEESITQEDVARRVDYYRNTNRRLIVVFVSLFLLIPLLGTAIIAYEQPKVESNTYNNLKAIAALEVVQVESWLKERHGDGQTLARDASFIEQVAELIGGDPEAGAKLSLRLSAFRDAYGYHALTLVDATGAYLLHVGERHEITADSRKHVGNLSAGEPFNRLPFYRDMQDDIHIDYIVPLRDDSRKAVAALLIHIEPGQFLFPYLHLWPGEGGSGESLLVRRVDDNVQYISRPRRSAHEPLRLQQPLDEPDMPAAVALRSGEPGVFHGRDYRDKAVLAAWKPVAGTDWMIITMLDRDAVMQPLYELVWWLSLMSLFVLSCLAIIQLMLWRQQQRVYELAVQAEQVKTDRVLRHFYELPFIGMAITSPTTRRWLQYNDHLCDILGYACDELGDKTWTELTHPDDKEENEKQFDRVFRGETEGYEIDKRFIRKDGSIVDATIDVKAVRNESGEVDYFVTTVQDITKRKRAEQTLREREAQLRTLVDTIPDLVWLKDTEGVFLNCNSSFEDFFGAQKADIIGRTDYDFVDRELADFFRKNDHKAIEAGRPNTNEEWLRFKGNGYHGLFETIKTPMYDEQGKRVGILGIARDITLRKKSEEERRLAAKVFEQSREGIVISDEENRIVMANRAFAGITGFSEQEVLGQNLYMPLAMDQDEAFYREIWRSLDDEGYWHGELRNTRSDGNTYMQWMSVTCTLDGNGDISGYIAIVEDITERKEYEEKIHWLAHFDTVTGLPNRTLLADRSRSAMSMAQRNRQQVAMLYCDLDHFKNINDTLGHSVGDRLLSEVAERLTGNLRDEDTVSRQGGDEFVILIPDAGTSRTAHICQKIMSVISQPYHIDDYVLDMTLSIGISMYPDDGADFGSLAKNADIAMYRAKEMGRNNYCFFTPELQKSTERVLRLESDIRRALERDELLLHYQPQVSLADGSITGVEVLLRWKHTELGMISPVEFIHIAEYTGQILPIGEWVLRTAVSQLQDWLRQGLAPMKVAVNLSVLQLRQPRLADSIAEILDESGLDAGLLELEVTESMVMEEQETAIEILNRINALGVCISIDDFGTGYSSLAYLKRLPMHYLKIDKIFIQDMLTNEEDATIARTIIKLGHSLGYEIIAEGVETEAQLDFLREHQCDYVQGYLFSKPLPADEILPLLLAPATVFHTDQPGSPGQ